MVESPGSSEPRGAPPGVRRALGRRGAVVLVGILGGVEMELLRGVEDLPQQDHAQFCISLPTLLGKTKGYKKNWLLAVHSARNRQAQRRGQQADPQAETLTRQDIRNWIKTDRWRHWKSHNSWHRYRPFCALQKQNFKCLQCFVCIFNRVLRRVWLGIDLAFLVSSDLKHILCSTFP